MKKLVLLLFVCLFTGMGVLTLVSLVRDAIIVGIFPQKIVRREEVSIRSQVSLGRNQFRYVLLTPRGEITASGVLSADSRLIPTIEWPWQDRELRAYFIVDNIWFLSFLRTVGLSLLVFFVACLRFELKKAPNQSPEPTPPSGVAHL